MEEVVLIEKSAVNSIVNLIAEGSNYNISLGDINKFLNLLQNLPSYSRDKIKIEDENNKNLKNNKNKRPEITTDYKENRTYL